MKTATSSTTDSVPRSCLAIPVPRSSELRTLELLEPWHFLVKKMVHCSQKTARCVLLKGIRTSITNLLNLLNLTYRTILYRSDDYKILQEQRVKIRSSSGSQKTLRFAASPAHRRNVDDFRPAWSVNKERRSPTMSVPDSSVTTRQYAEAKASMLLRGL